MHKNCRKTLGYVGYVLRLDCPTFNELLFIATFPGIWG
jgi:hypothetical protein